MAIGVSQVGSVFDPTHGIFANTALHSDDSMTSITLGSASSGTSAKSLTGLDRVVASHGGATIVGGARDVLAGSSGSHTLDALKHADSFVGSAGKETYSLGGSVVHDRIFTASHLVVAPPTVAPVADVQNAASHITAATLTLGENTTVHVKDVTPTLGGGHFK